MSMITTPLLQPPDNDDDYDGVDPESALLMEHHHSPTFTSHDEEHPTNNNNDEEEEEEDEEVEYESHFTLRIPTSTVHFRGSTLRVIDTDHDQIILQQQQQQTRHDGQGQQQRTTKKNKVVIVKRLSPSTYANRFLRIGYTLITILFLGFLFVFALQVLLFLFIALPVDGGYTSEGGTVDVIGVISTLLSFPVMLHGLASLMAMGSAFVVDTYNGAALFRSTIVEILYMCVFLVVPIATFGFSLMAKSSEPWRVTAGSWAIMVAITFAVWGCAVTHKQVMACFWLVERYCCDNNGEASTNDASTNDDADNVQTGGALKEEEGRSSKGLFEKLSPSQDERIRKEWTRLKKIAHQAVLLTQIARYSGHRMERYHTMTEMHDDDVGEHDTPLETSMNIYSRLTSKSFCSCLFEAVVPPKRIYSSDEVRDIVPFMTKNNWSMQRMWCSGDSRRNNVIVARGPSALTLDQIRFSALCTFISSLLVLLLAVSVLVWLELGIVTYIIIALLVLLCCIVPITRNSIETYRMYDGVNKEEEDQQVEEETDGTNMLQVWQTYRITQPKLWYCYLRVSCEVVFLFLWPFIFMLVQGNYPVAFFFLLLASFTFVWRYFNALDVLSELGSISDLTDKKTISHQQEYRLSEVVARVIDKKSRKVWAWIFIVFFLVLFVLLLQSQTSTNSFQPQDRGERPPILLVDDFYYPGDDNTLAYPTCKLTKGFEFAGSNGVESASDLGDYSFLSAMSYEKLSVVTYLLTHWFGGPNVLVDEEEFVTQYRKDMGDSSPVYFKLFSLPEYPGYGIMSIRGSETAMDWISNLQLWSAAGLAQIVKWLTPLGWVWGPIIPDLVHLVSMVETEAIQRVSYYKTTTKFVNDVLENGYGEDIGKDFTNIHITGVSLGGGLAIITGAQTSAYTVAFSGMGATLSRYTYDPPVELDKLNQHTFNFIPERDYIARIGGRAPLYQNGMCIAPNNDLFGCHSMWRSICELSYRCGSHSRPVACRCVEELGYPEPIQNGTRSFAQACQEANTAWYDMFPPTN